MTTTVTGSYLYPEPPTPMELEAVRKTIGETSQPEGVPSLSWDKPDKKIEHRLFHPKITVDRKRRPDGKMVPCSLCSGASPKCLSFYLLWSSDERLRVVGHICGPKYFGVAEFRKMEQDAQAETSRLANQNFLLDNLPNLHLWISDLDALEPACEQAQRVRRKFKKGVPSLFQELARMLRDHNGDLVIQRQKSAGGPSGFRSSLGGGESEYEILPVAHLRGKSFVSPSYNPAATLLTIRRKLEPLAGGFNLPLVEDDVLELVENMDDGTLARSAKTFRDVERQAVRLVGRIYEIREFLLEPSTDALDRWGGHPENDFKFSVERGETSVTFRVTSRERVTLATRDQLLMRPWSRML